MKIDKVDPKILNSYLYTNDDSNSLQEYGNIMHRLLKSYAPEMDNRDLNNLINYSIQKRYEQVNINISNSYTHKEINMTILALCDYIADKQPIMTSYGVLFKRHGTVLNPIATVIDSFLNNRGIFKTEMFKYLKGSELFEKFNLLQLLAKIDANAIYGLNGLYVSIIYNTNVAPSITSMGRSLISSAIMCFEMFFSNNVLFGSIDEVLTFIDNVRREYKSWKFLDEDVLDFENNVTIAECFNKIVSTCGYEFYVPDNKDLDIIWNILSTCSQRELNRLYYKNNLYGFLDNSKVKNLIIDILLSLNTPYMVPGKPPVEVKERLNLFRDLLTEYVFYCYQIIDRIDRNKNMVKNMILASDTDSAFVSLDAFYRFSVDLVKGIDMPILHQSLDVVNYIENIEKNELKEFEDWSFKYNPNDTHVPIEYLKASEEDGKIHNPFVTYEEPELDFDFYNDEIIELKKTINMCEFLPQDNLKFSIINMMCYVLEHISNLYMIDFTKNTNSYRGDENCRIILKNEFFIYRMLLKDVKKNYATLLGIQEGKYLGDGGVLSITGMESMKKTTMPDKTKEKLKKILFEDVLSAKCIDQMKLVKSLAIAEKQIYTEVLSGSKDYYKPLKIKSMGAYEQPFRQQGIKASISWNYLKDEKDETIDLSIRNTIDVVKVNITYNSIEKIRDEYPIQYEKLLSILRMEDKIVLEDTMYGNHYKIPEVYKSGISSIALPKASEPPQWLIRLIDIETIVSDNLSGFPADSIGISQMDNKGAIYTNNIKL